jgi:hypothetical protein
VNDSLENAHELAELLAGRPVLINLIPYNANVPTPTNIMLLTVASKNCQRPENQKNGLETHFEVQMLGRFFALGPSRFDVQMMSAENAATTQLKSAERDLTYSYVNAFLSSEQVTAEIYGFKGPTEEVGQAFGRVLVERGLYARLRVERGGDIGAACGQLALTSTTAAQKIYEESAAGGEGGGGGQGEVRDIEVII